MPPLYKFIADPESVGFLLQGSIKFTPIPELNDPSELMPNLIPEAVRDSLTRLREHGYSDDDMLWLQKEEALLRRLAPAYRAFNVPASRELATAVVRSQLYESTTLLEQLLDGAAREMSSRVGLFCLSQRYDSLPMWAHYAANASGLVVEFVDLENVFRGDHTGVLDQPVAVRYERERVGVTFDPRSHESIFFTKFEDWSYEQEVRVVRPLDACEHKRVGDNVLYLHDIPPQCISRLILGWKMQAPIAAMVRTRVRELNPRVAVVEARFRRGHVCLDEP